MRMRMWMLVLLSDLHSRRRHSHGCRRLAPVREEVKVEIDVERRLGRVGVVCRVRGRCEVHAHGGEGEVVEVEQRRSPRAGRVDEVSRGRVMGKLEDRRVGRGRGRGRSRL